MLFLNITGKANRVSGLGELWMEGRITIFWVLPSLALLQSPHPRHTHHTHTHAHIPPTIPLRVASSAQARLHFSGSGLGWPSPLLGSHYPTSLSSLVPLTKSSSGPWRMLTFVLCGQWVQCQPHPLLFGVSWWCFDTCFQVPHMPVGHMLDSLGGSIKTLSFDLREKKSPFCPPRDTGRSPETWQLCQRSPLSTTCLKPGLGWRAPACWTGFPASAHALLRTGGACTYCAVARLQRPAGSPSQADIYHPLTRGLEYWQRNEQQQKIMSVLGLGKQTQKGDNHNFFKVPWICWAKLLYILLHDFQGLGDGYGDQSNNLKFG